MGTFAERVAAHQPSPKCKVAAIIGRLDKTDAAALVKILAAPLDEWPHTAIKALLVDEGIDVSTSVLGTHRRKECACVAR